MEWKRRLSIPLTCFNLTTLCSPIANGTPDDSDSESSSEEESEGDAVRNSVPAPTSHGYASDHAECEELGTAGDIGYVHTKNELVESDIVVPDISQVDPTDVLEKLGEVMSIVGNVVIVKGLPADNVKTLAERALDIETLLVFEDRQVLGHVRLVHLLLISKITDVPQIYETFGPTSQPLYQIKFNQKYPLDIEKVRIYREVFHVPQKSKYIFVDQLKRLRGSDASNMHDEEPAEDELEFSDDEQEAAFKQQRKRKSVRSSLFSDASSDMISGDSILLRRPDRVHQRRHKSIRPTTSSMVQILTMHTDHTMMTIAFLVHHGHPPCLTTIHMPNLPVK